MICAKCGSCCVVPPALGRDDDPNNINREWILSHKESLYTVEVLGRDKLYYMSKPGAPCKHLNNKLCAIYKDRPPVCRDNPIGFDCNAIRKDMGLESLNPLKQTFEEYLIEREFRDEAEKEDAERCQLIKP